MNDLRFRFKLFVWFGFVGLLFGLFLPPAWPWWIGGAAGCGVALTIIYLLTATSRLGTGTSGKPPTSNSIKKPW